MRETSPEAAPARVIGVLAAAAADEPAEPLILVRAARQRQA